MHQSVATIDSPEFLNLQPIDINPLMSKCEIKVFYIGGNRNHSFINQETAIEMGKTLRGAPIVGYYKNSKEDFVDHGEKVIIDDEGIKFECQTVPYGFVSPDAKVWFQNFQEQDGFGNKIIRKYLMTTGYLWTGQFPESSLPVNEGRPQSMELEPNTVDGHWEKNPTDNIEYFIINDAVIQKICILGDDVQPCFQGAAVTAPNISNKFMLDDGFKKTLFSMMEDLRKVLNRGGQNMGTPENENVVIETTQFTQDQSVEETTINAASTTETIDNTSTDYAKKEETDSKDDQKDTSNDESENEKTSDDDKEKNEAENKKKYSLEDSEEYRLLKQELNKLQENYSSLQKQYEALVDFKNQINNQQKDALISEFYMLSDADKADVIKNKDKYTLEEIKAKLSVICFDKKINFTSENEEKEQTQPTVTFSIGMDEVDSNLPEWVKAVKQVEKNI